jgi:hypothetical protein
MRPQKPKNKALDIERNNKKPVSYERNRHQQKKMRVMSRTSKKQLWINEEF